MDSCDRVVINDRTIIECAIARELRGRPVGSGILVTMMSGFGYTFKTGFDSFAFEDSGRRYTVKLLAWGTERVSKKTFPTTDFEVDIECVDAAGPSSADMPRKRPARLACGDPKYN